MPPARILSADGTVFGDGVVAGNVVVAVYALSGMAVSNMCAYVADRHLAWNARLKQLPNQNPAPVIKVRHHESPYRQWVNPCDMYGSKPQSRSLKMREKVAQFGLGFDAKPMISGHPSKCVKCRLTMRGA